MKISVHIVLLSLLASSHALTATITEPDESILVYRGFPKSSKAAHKKGALAALAAAAAAKKGKKQPPPPAPAAAPAPAPVPSTSPKASDTPARRARKQRTWERMDED